MDVSLQKFDKQVGGRTTLFQILGDHLLKPTSAYEVEAYLKMNESVMEVAPQVCYIFKNGKVIEQNKCLNCYSRSQISAIGSLAAQFHEGYYLIMRDATHGLTRPRVLDIKLGTRTYSDHIPEEKKKSRILKLAKTTSKSLGLRLSGAGYIPQGHEQKITITKPTGMAMNKHEFTDTMREFFNVPSEHKQEVIRQLQKIKKAVEDSPNLRFFGSSLLVVIEKENKIVQKAVKVKLIDFANQARSEPGQIQYIGLDDGALFGVDNFIDIIGSV
ncbi:unnamed protein product [Caenorhabditis sp. 36 PRJEB53466]|nr:unnamed protein product [Caenorhabditis sp. 36 PRJEB53466]